MAPTRQRAIVFPASASDLLTAELDLRRDHRFGDIRPDVAAGCTRSTIMVLDRARDLPKRPTNPAARLTLLVMTAPPGPPSPTAASAAIESLMLQVNRETVLQARAALLGEAQRLRDEIQRHGDQIVVRLCGGDPVSPDASKAFGERIAVLISHCDRYVTDLENAGKQLADTARLYGFTEAEIAGSFGA
jgi:hypothetical protein